MNLTRRLAQLYAGLVLYGASMALQIRAALGLDPWDVFHQGLARHIGVSFGTATMVTGAGVLLLWIPLRQRPGLGTPRDGLMTGLCRRTGRSVRLVRACIELTVLAVGLLMGGSVGIGTVAYALGIGPLVQFFLPLFTVPERGPAPEPEPAPDADADAEGAAVMAPALVSST